MMRKGHGKGILRSLAFTDVYFSLQREAGSQILLIVAIKQKLHV